MKNIIDQDEVIYIAEVMIKHGGSFVQALGHALIHADPMNQIKIKRAFPEYWEKYTEMAKKNE